MKRIIVLLISISLLITPSLAFAQHKIGDIIGTVYNTDIVAYINHYAIPSYAANGQSLIVVEDLANFGFEVRWDSVMRTLFVTRNSNTTPNVMNFEKQGVAGSKFADLLYTDIIVSANGYTIPSYSINGYTLIPLEGLRMFGEINWVEDQRAIKLWLENFNVRSEMQPVNAYSTQLHAFRDVAKFLTENGYYNDEYNDYNLDWENDELSIFVSYNPTEDYIMFLSYEGALEMAVVIFPGEEYCLYEVISRESGIEGSGRVKMSEIANIEYLPFDNIESDYAMSYELKQRFIELAGEAFATNLVGAYYVLFENNCPRTMSELGFVFFEEFDI